MTFKVLTEEQDFETLLCSYLVIIFYWNCYHSDDRQFEIESEFTLISSGKRVNSFADLSIDNNDELCIIISGSKIFEYSKIMFRHLTLPDFYS